MPLRPDSLRILEFKTRAELRAWLTDQPGDSTGIWVRVFKKASSVPSVTFEELLDEGLCFGWSESARRRYDETSYLQKITPRRTRGTNSERNRRRIAELTAAGRMTDAGLKAL